MDPRIEKILKLPQKQKIALLLVVTAAIGVGIYYGLCLPKQKELAGLKEKLNGLQNQVSESRKIADNLPRLEREYGLLQKELEKALTELPNQKEIPTLLTSITNAGKSAGLDFLLFRPKGEEPKEFYASVPVDITVSGSFNSVANFFIAVGNLPRIVNISNVSFSDIRQTGGRTTMTVNCLATTFRFLDKKEIKDVKK